MYILFSFLISLNFLIHPKNFKFVTIWLFVQTRIFFFPIFIKELVYTHKLAVMNTLVITGWNALNIKGGMKLLGSLSSYAPFDNKDFRKFGVYFHMPQL